MFVQRPGQIQLHPRDTEGRGVCFQWTKSSQESAHLRHLPEPPSVTQVLMAASGT